MLTGLTQCDNDGDDHRSPERNVTEQDYYLIVKVIALEEGIEHDPKQHDDRRSDDDQPGEEGPT
jgi:hypothetical protein